MSYYIPVRKNMRDNYHGVSRLHDDIDRLFGRTMFPGAYPGWARGARPEAVTPQADLAPAAEVTSTSEAFCLRLELPGVSPEAVNIKVADNVLTVSGEKKNETPEKETVHVQERSFGIFARSLNLPEDADAEGIRAFAKDGVLLVEIPRKRPEQARTRTIEVQRG